MPYVQKHGELPESFMLSNYAKGFLAGKRDEKRDRIPSLTASFLKGFFAMMKDPDQSVEDPI